MPKFEGKKLKHQSEVYRRKQENSVGEGKWILIVLQIRTPSLGAVHTNNIPSS